MRRVFIVFFFFLIFFIKVYVIGTQAIQMCIYMYISKTCLFKYTAVLRISPPKTASFQIKIDIFHICGYSLEPPCRSSSNEYLQSLFMSRNKKNKVYPCKPQFYYIKVGFKGVKII